MGNMGNIPSIPSHYPGPLGRAGSPATPLLRGCSSAYMGRTWAPAPAPREPSPFVGPLCTDPWAKAGETPTVRAGAPWAHQRPGWVAWSSGGESDSETTRLGCTDKVWAHGSDWLSPGRPRARRCPARAASLFSRPSSFPRKRNDRKKPPTATLARRPQKGPQGCLSLQRA